MIVTSEHGLTLRLNIQENKGKTPDPSWITALSCVWRAGRAGALTDHSSVLFDIGSDGVFKKATTNAHWYKVRPSQPFLNT